MPIDVLCLAMVPETQRAGLAAAGYVLHDHVDTALRSTAPDNAEAIRAVITRGGTAGITREMIYALPNLEIICTMAAGFDKVDMAAARERGIIVTHGPGTNATSVADHAIALMFSIARAIVYGDAAARRGDWQTSRGARPLVVGKTLGIMGLGRIGLLIAKRLSGLDLTILYHNRQRRKDAPYTYVSSLLELAARSDFLIIAAPGGADTLHAVNADVLEALGPSGYLINIARGSIVPTDALVAALKDRKIAGAAIDVFEGEPDLPPALREITDNLIVTPHMAGAAVEARAAIEELMLRNLNLHFSGQPVATPVPWKGASAVATAAE
jgi:lactate dehydrogenase-like 2-hydroxyacid dehydrogenase